MKLKIDEKLMASDGWYSVWHKHKASIFIHWGFLIVYVLTLAAFIQKDLASFPSQDPLYTANVAAQGPPKNHQGRITSRDC